MSRDVFITSTAGFLPNEAVGNDDMERILGQVGDKPSRARKIILRSNGIESRHYAIDPNTLEQNYSNATMTAAAVRALQNDSFSIDNIDCLACGTSIADQLMPNHAVMVQGELGLPACEAVATSGVCASGMAALKYAQMNVALGLSDAAVATGSDLSSAMMRGKNFQQEINARVSALEKNPEIAFEKDFLRWMLSDGAGAFLLQANPADSGLSLRIDWIESKSFAGEMEACMYAGAVKQLDGSLLGWQQVDEDGDSVMAVKQDVKLLNAKVIEYTVEKPLSKLIEKYELDPATIDVFVPHYSSQFFRDRVYAGMKKVDFDLPQSRWFSNLTYAGNTGAASIYIMLDELLRSGRLYQGQRLLCYIPESGRFTSAWLHLTVV